MRYRFAIWLLRPLLYGERWRCIGALKATDEHDQASARTGGFFQGRLSVLDDLLDRKTLPWMSDPPRSKGVQ